MTTRRKFLLVLLLLAAIGAFSMARGPGPSWNKIETPIIQPVDEAESTSRQTHGFGSLTRSGRWIFLVDLKMGWMSLKFLPELS